MQSGYPKIERSPGGLCVPVPSVHYKTEDTALAETPVRTDSAGWSPSFRGPPPAENPQPPPHLLSEMGVNGGSQSC